KKNWILENIKIPVNAEVRNNTGAVITKYNIINKAGIAIAILNHCCNNIIRVPDLAPSRKFLNANCDMAKFSLTLLLSQRVNIFVKPRYSSGVLVYTLAFF